MPKLAEKMRATAKAVKEIAEQERELERLLARFSPDVVASVMAKRGYQKPSETATKHKAPKAETLLKQMTRHNYHPVCHHCGSMHYNRYGVDERGWPRFYCLDCHHTYGLQSNSFVRYSRWSYDEWVTFVHHTLLGSSLAEIQQIFLDDLGLHISQATLLAQRHKLFDAILHHYPMPQLSGVVQVDETFFRESQKGSWKLINVAPGILKSREARTPWNKVKARLGINGPEFSCVVVGIDNVGHIVAVVTGLGRNSAEPFEEYFSEYLGDVDFLCSDGFPIYAWYCEKHNVLHYVQLSTARDTIQAKQKEHRLRFNQSVNESYIRKELYGKNELDYINYLPRKLTYEQFEELKKSKGLCLERVDHTHRQIKRYINNSMAGVSTVYLHRYMSFYCFRHNWTVDHGGKPPTSMKTAEEIFQELLFADNAGVERNKLTSNDLLKMTRVSTKYTRMLAKTTEEMREKAGFRGLTIADGDTLVRFDKLKYFRTAPKSQLLAIAREYGIKDRSKMGAELLAHAIYNLPERDDIFRRLILSDSAHRQYADDIAGILKQEANLAAEDEEKQFRQRAEKDR